MEVLTVICYFLALFFVLYVLTDSGNFSSFGKYAHPMRVVASILWPLAIIYLLLAVAICLLFNLGNK